ncbi:MAG TPA: phospholipase A [Flavobacterium sp.]|nr:phospholipase A [Flavobacterium sp.]
MKNSVLLYIFIFSVSISNGQSDSNEKEIVTQTYAQSWDLDSIGKKRSFKISSYKFNYLTPARITNHVNTKPQSENPIYSTTEAVDYDNIEVKFQLSFKAKLIQSIFKGKGDIWLGYTQIAHIQSYNVELSRPIREIDFEPELIFKYPIKVQLLGGHLNSVGIAYNHQSNGKDFPLSRSWNRIIFDTTYENNNWIISIRPWIRLSEGDEIDSDENPAITDYIGNGELNISYTYKRHLFYTNITHPFTHLYGGSIQLNYIFPITALLCGQVQFFNGYGETLIDYNFNQTTIGVGVSLANW